MNSKRKKVYLLFFSIISFCAYSQESAEDNSTIEPILKYVGDAGRNITGGIKTGNAYNGLFDAGVIIKSDKWYNGGSLTIEMQNTHGNELSGNYVGDIQYISNIENNDYTYLYQLYYKQDFSMLYFIVGIHDLNTEFVISEFGAALTNSSFGIHSTFPLNFGVSIFPKTSLSFIGAIKYNENFIYRIGLYDGDVSNLDDEKYNLKWKINKDEGILSIHEFELKPITNNTIKLGAYYHTGKFFKTNDFTTEVNGNWGIYGIVDQVVYEKDENKRGGVFFQFGITPSSKNINTKYFGAGLNFNGLIPSRSKDGFAIGFTYAGLYDDTWECDIEANYLFSLGKHFNIQPCIHYVIHPGANAGYKNSFAPFI